MEFVILAVVIAVAVIGTIAGLVVSGRRRKAAAEGGGTGHHAAEGPAPSRTPGRRRGRATGRGTRQTIEEVQLPPAPAVEEAPALEVPEPTAGRLVRLRSRLSRSQNSLGKGLLDAALPRAPRRGHLGGDRGHPAHRRRRRRARPRSSSSGCAPGSRCSAPARPPSCAPCSRGAGHAARPGRSTAPLHTDRARGRPPGRRAGRRRQRHRQDHHHRQARPGAGRRRPHGGARRGRHLPGRRRRPAADLGRAGRRADGARARGRRPGLRSRSTRSSRASPRAPTPCSSTPPAGCTPRPA